jgi:hypothetical protein
VNTSERLVLLRVEMEREELDAFIILLDEESRLGKLKTMTTFILVFLNRKIVLFQLSASFEEQPKELPI